MIHGRFNDNIIKYLHRICLRLIYSDKISSYEAILEDDRSVSVYHKDIQILVEMFKIKNSMSLGIVSDIFYLRQKSSQPHATT